MLDLKSKTVLVTGGSKGIGAAIVAAIGRRGAYVVVHYGSDRAGAEQAAADIADDHKLLVAADLRRPAEVDRLWQDALAWRERIDVFVNNAAVMLWHGGIGASDEDWDAVWGETLQVNVLAASRLMRNAVRHYLEEGGGVIVTISSWAAQRGVTNPDTASYGASKAAIRSFTQSIARGYAKNNILAYVIAPGVVRTRLSEQFAATQGGEEKVTAGLAMGEWVPPAEIGELVAFLASGRVRHLSGATLDVNGASYVR
jgi:NAD(P)-dependent dehydrogenase (short-subunit alcohol dehydrogenase family)